MEAGEAERGAILLKKGGLGEGQKVRGLRGVGGLRGGACQHIGMSVRSWHGVV